MIQLIVNGDDFGYSRGVNHGIVDAHLNGIVNSTTMMMNTLGTQHAIELAKETPSLKIGIHLVLTCGKPLSKNVPSLTDYDGNFKKQADILAHKDVDLFELEQEWTAQIEAFLSTGLTPTHFDSHHHMHGIKEFYPVVKSLSHRYNLPVRNVNHELTDLSLYTDLFFDDFYGDTVTDDYFHMLVNRVNHQSVVEVMCHPAYVDQELMVGSSYNLSRVRETSILTNVVLPEIFTLI